MDVRLPASCASTTQCAGPSEQARPSSTSCCSISRPADSAARLLRQLHDATTDCHLRDGRDVVCHGDAGPVNCVFVNGTVAFIDFDCAHAGSRLDDVGYAAWFWTDIGNDEMSAAEQGRRVADFFQHYGLGSAGAIDAIALAQTALAARTDSAGVRQWAEACRARVESHRDALAAATARPGL